jgi:hypothetical protein
MTNYIDYEHIIIYIIAGLISIVSFFSIRILRQVDKSQEKLWEKFDLHETRLSTLEGEHKVFTRLGEHK